MKNKLKQNTETIGIIAVVFSLLFVAFQIQQANRIAIATTEIEVSNNFSSLNELMMENREFAALLEKGRKGGEEFTSVEEIVYSSFVRRLFNIWRGIETAYQNGMLPDHTYGLMLDDARGAIGGAGPIGRGIWRETLDIYPSLASTELFVLLYRLLNEHDSAEN